MKNRNRVIALVGIMVIGSAIAYFLSKKDFAVEKRSYETAAVPNPSPSPGGPVQSTQRRFSNMSLEERNRILDEIKQQDPLLMFHTWLDSGRLENDLRKQRIVGALLAHALQEAADAREVYGQMDQFIADSANPITERGELIHLLGLAATEASLEILIRSAKASPQGELRQIALREIRSAGEQRWNSQFHEELSPPLEKVWQESDDGDLLSSVAVAMAEVGAPAGIQHLLAPITSGQTESDLRVQAARGALSLVRNPNAVPVLAALLVNRPTVDSTAVLASSILAEMVDASATEALVRWLESADEGAASLAYSYVIRTRMPAMLEAWESALNPAVPFKSEKNREAIQKGLIEYHQNRKSGL